MKKGVVEFIKLCPNYHKLKVEHQKPTGLVQKIDIPFLKWKAINMDFITGYIDCISSFTLFWVSVD